MTFDQSLRQPYQVILLGPDAANRMAVFSESLRLHVQALGLDPSTDTEVLHFDDVSSAKPIRWQQAPVFVWCGAANNSADMSAQSDLAKEALKCGNPVFAVVESVIQPEFWKQVPAVLSAFNGVEWSRLSELVGHVLQAFGMYRRGKRTFISYRRKESREIAVQLFDLLQHRGYDVFLDTASIAPGRDVQQDLKARLADVDVVILLHTHGAFDSAWVYEEILDAQLRGTEVLDVRWPGIQPLPELTLAEPFELQTSDLVTQVTLVIESALRMTSQAQLNSTCLERLLPRVEGARIRSVRTRRDRIVKQLSEDAGLFSMEAVFCPTGSDLVSAVPHMLIRDPRNLSVRGVTFVSDGIPGSRDIHTHAAKLAGAVLPAGDRARIVYDEFGVLVEDLNHLDWLNRAISGSGHVRTDRLCDTWKWMKTL